MHVQGGIDDLFGYNGPSQISTQIRHRPDVLRQDVLAAFDSIIHEVQQTGVSQEELDQIKIKWRSEYFARMESGGSYMPKFGLMHLMGCFTLFDNNPQLVNTILDDFLNVTPDQLLRVSRKYLRKENRAIVYRVPLKKQGQH